MEQHTEGNYNLDHSASSALIRLIFLISFMIYLKYRIVSTFLLIIVDKDVLRAKRNVLDKCVLVSEYN